MLEVLWIDDQCRCENGEYTIMGRNVIEYAYSKEIEITAITTYEEGIELIKKNPRKWIAVILDIRDQRATNGNAVSGYLKAVEDFKKLRAEHKGLELYVFTLSGEKKYQEEDTLVYKPEYCSKSVYEKCNEDYKILFDDIKKITNISVLYKIRSEYEDVLRVARRIGDDEYWLIELIYRVLELSDRTTLNDLRKYVERYIIPYLNKVSFFSPEINVSCLNECSRYIGKQNNVPVYIKRSIHSLVEIIQDGSHANMSTIVDRELHEGRAPYVLKSCLFELLNVVYWLDNYR